MQYQKRDEPFLQNPLGTNFGFPNIPQPNDDLTIITTPLIKFIITTGRR